MYILLNPGPVNLSKRVRKALLKPDLCHREIEFTELQNNIRQKLLEVYSLNPVDWAAILLTGSGTSAMEAMLTSVVPDDGKVLVVENGVYGERLSKIAGIYNIDYLNLHYRWGDEILPDELDKALTDEITHVAVIHHETTTGRLNNLADISSICKSRNIPVLVDGVSSFAAEEIIFNDWNVIACAATANKCLHGVPGASFVICKREALGLNKQRSLYLDLDTYLQQQDGGGTPFTQSIQCFYALEEALDEHYEQGGWKARNEMYWNRMDRVREGFDSIGINALLEKKDCSSVLNSFYLPGKTDYSTLHDELKKRGFVIYAGQGDLSRSIFRISLMGEINDDAIQGLISSMAEII